MTCHSAAISGGLVVQVDVFWSYGMGSGFALAAANQLRARTDERLLTTPYFTGTVLYLALLFAPSGVWLLWAYPSWETMHAGTRALPAWLVALFAVTNVTQGVLGFWVTRRLLVRGRIRAAVAQLLCAYAGFFFILVHGWDGTGYRRFFSATPTDLRAWSTGSVGHWLGSGVAVTLYGMGLVLIPALLAITARWHAAGTGSGSGIGFAGATLGLIVGLGLGVAVVASVLVDTAGWVVGGLLAAGLLALILVPRKGPAAWYGRAAVPVG
jgi:hypothetical protein